MSKLIVETTGKFMLVDMMGKQSVEWNRPTLVQSSHFINERCANGQIKVIAEDIPEAGCDEDFAKFLADSKDVDSAIANYCTTLGAKEEAQVVAVAPKAKAKPAAKK